MNQTIPEPALENKPPVSTTTETLFNCAIRSALDADQLRERLNLALAACAEYREKLDEAQADSRRLDWLEQHAPAMPPTTVGLSLPEWRIYGDSPDDTIREAIDGMTAHRGKVIKQLQAAGVAMKQEAAP